WCCQIEFSFWSRPTPVHRPAGVDLRSARPIVACVSCRAPGGSWLKGVRHVPHRRYSGATRVRFFLECCGVSGRLAGVVVGIEGEATGLEEQGIGRGEARDGRHIQNHAVAAA
ncbi:MAG: hypothetical protein RLY87_454, partial [Chloroflexota bacterium]